MATGIPTSHRSERRRVERLAHPEHEDQGRRLCRSMRIHGVPPAIAEDTHDLTDALVVGGLLISLLRHADRVRIACVAQLVNVIPLIRTIDGGPAWRQTKPTSSPWPRDRRRGWSCASTWKDRC